ncbi:hypothetical protein QYM36_014662 [Artemia franciscana]|uniref:Papilin n=1 Tax=Artemia franciscana TaxID=6661 RepID=A0AA88L3P5_ARTSF|nr:hypothetical protein QYM36_014662 [Artemia franciscana]
MITTVRMRRFGFICSFVLLLTPSLLAHKLQLRHHHGSARLKRQYFAAHNPSYILSGKIPLDFEGLRPKRQEVIVNRETDFVLGGSENSANEGKGPWSEWSEPSECSRTCGGGVSIQTRQCLQNSENSDSCSGPSRKFFSCNVQDCPEGSLDFRSEQCARYNSVPFEGKYYDWIPYTRAPNKCELNCMPRGERFYYRHRSRVIDGTPCDDEKDDICVDGNCLRQSELPLLLSHDPDNGLPRDEDSQKQPVGCDKILGSDAKEDNCRVCGGDGTKCTTITGNYTTPVLQVGYNDIVLIPAGATNIKISEIKASNNYLSLRNSSGHYYLNGNWRIDYPRDMKFCGTTFKYERKSQSFFAPEVISAVGPTDEALYLVLLYQEANPGIEYEYSIPSNVSVAQPDVYQWAYGAWSECNASCGGGQQTRNVSCSRTSNFEVVSDNLCDPQLMPSSVRPCNTDPCPAKWFIGNWTECSVSCGIGGGVQFRTVYCEQQMNGLYPSVVPDQVCLEDIGSKPISFQKCNEDLICPSFYLEDWGPCDQLCGEGIRRRKVTCHRKISETIEILDDDACGEERPLEEEFCHLRPCEGVDWIASQWSGCNDRCGLTVETRSVLCVDPAGSVVNETFCQALRRPDTERPCADATLCEHGWHATEWSECSSTCGAGIQTRRVFCGSKKGDCVTEVSDELCDPTKRYENTTECHNEQCQGEWFTGPFSKCSKDCGGGIMARKIFCITDGESNPTACDADKIPFGTESCNKYDCSDLITTPLPDTDLDVCTDEDYEDEEEYFEESGEVEAESGELICEVIEEVGSSTIEEDLASRELTIVESGSGVLDVETSTTATVITPDASGEEEAENKLGSGVSIDGSGEIGSGFVGQARDGLESISGLDLSSDGATEGYNTVDGSAEGDISSGEKTSDSLSDTAEDVKSTEEDKTIEDSLESFTESIPEETVDRSAESTIGATTEDKVDASAETPVDTSAEGLVDTGIEGIDASAEGILDTVEDRLDASAEGAIDSSGEAMLEVSEEKDTEASAEAVIDESREEKIDASAERIDSSAEGINSSAEGIDSSAEVEIVALESEDLIEGSGSDTGNISNLESGNDVDDSGSGEEVSSGFVLVPESEEATDEEIGDLKENDRLTAKRSVRSANGLSSQEGSGEVLDYDVKAEYDPVTTIAQPKDEEISADASSGDEDISVLTTSLPVTSEAPKLVTICKKVTKIPAPKKTKKLKTKRPCKPRIDLEDDEPLPCEFSDFGCCSDGRTAAKGPFEQNCPKPKTCDDTEFGCCPDKYSPAQGPEFEGCPPPTCESSLFGCCDDGITSAETPGKENCPVIETVTEISDDLMAVACKDSEFGCCQDGLFPAKGPNGEGCGEPQIDGSGIDISSGSGDDTQMPTEGSTEALTEGSTEDSIEASTDGSLEFEVTKTTVEDTTQYVDCKETEFGCCPDGISTALGEKYFGCDIVTEGCESSQFGCCEDQMTTASGPNGYGCPEHCATTEWGCCDDDRHAAQGPAKEGCCVHTEFGCCPDNIQPAQGANLEGCGCEYTQFGCCPDKQTAARGPENEGCGCHTTVHGCCPDNYTPAAGPNYSGCPCNTFEFGCCSDGIRPAKGPDMEGCGCKESEFGCCGDQRTPATGPNQESCDCASSRFGCCLDGVSEAQGENFEECKEKPIIPGDICGLEKDRGPCRNFTVKWFFDTEYGGCSRFWYGGCEGNGNRFMSQDECKSTCVEPEFPSACNLPKVRGPCEGSYPSWHYEPSLGVCKPFIYGCCLGNNNRFESQQACESKCVTIQKLDVCEQPAERGPCNGNYTRFYYDAATASCREFSYGGCKANLNNFGSNAECLQRCNSTGTGRSRDVCLLPRSEGPCSEKIPKWFFDGSENRCMPFYYSSCGGNANRFDSSAQCERTCPPITIQETDVCSYQPSAGNCTDYTERWYFDSREQRCIGFLYGGCQGNGNNFLTQADCEGRCATRKEAETTVDFKTEYCFLEKEEGPCRESIASFYYDKTDGVCKQFLYGGCNGNQNRFSTRQECENRCGNAQDVCDLPRIVGPCSGTFRQYYYDKSQDNCYEFSYGGCQGNGNRFNNLNECTQRCQKNKIETTVAPEPERRDDDICRLPAAQGPCRGSVPAWYYNQDNGLCQVFSYGGCGGNANRFVSEEQCKRQCGAFKGLDVCNSPPSPGPCSERFTKYYFEPRENRCQSFVYSGCGGSGNRFSSLDECEAVCVQKIEPAPPGNATETSHLAICHLPVSRGPCSEEYRRWAYERNSATCVPFVYSGCTGNLNNFRSFASCIEFCKPAIEHDRQLLESLTTEKPESENIIDTDEIKSKEGRCEKERQTCETLRCPYGVERYYVAETGCEDCRCHNPCRDHQCEDGMRCAPELYRGEGGETAVRASCRLVDKPGECPTIYGQSSNCERECDTDADCPGDRKCCRTDCGSSCVAPVLTTLAPTTTTTTETYFQTEEVGVPPRIVFAEPQVSAEEGNYATLKCDARGLPLPTITWRKGDQEIAGDIGKYRILADNSLQIIGLDRNDAGVYTCIASNGFGSPASRQTRLDVKVPLQVRVSTERQSYPSGSSITIKCDVEGYPPPLISWYKDEQQVQFNDRIQLSDDSALLIAQSEASDSGTYRCQATNDYGTTTGYTAISVEGIYIHPSCNDNPFFANCRLIVKARYCTNKYYARFCCKSCTLAGQLPPQGPHLQDLNKGSRRKK